MTSSSDPLLGKNLANFRIERPLGQGGMAQVYYGRDTILNRPVVVKVISRRHRRKSDYARRLIQEAQAIAQWRHDNIVQVYYAGEEKGLVFIVMEYIDGPDLSQVLADYAEKGALMPRDEALRIGRAVADALDYAHARGAIHRDVKPDNVIVARSGRVVLADFGLVIQAESDETGEMLGSAYYIAPEQAQSIAKTVARSDLYALGVMLYEMLAGQRPFDDPSPMSVALQHVTQPPPSPRLFNPDLPERTEAVLLKALHKLPEERYANGRALLDALADSLGGTAVSQDDFIGRQLDEYRLDVLLGQGGMARIYRGFDTRLKRQVAIKVIDAPHRAETTYRQRFEREAQAIAQLSHPNIVNVYRYGELSGLFYMAMQYVEGIDLRTWIDNYRRQDEFVPLPEVMRIIDEVCQALDYAHSKGIIHRDVKPANILVAEAGRIFLTDFGLVLRVGTATRGEIFGSPRYIAPEQAISSSGAVPQSDLYAVGVILYEMLTGRLPFDASDPLNMAMQHMSETPPSPRELRPELSPAVEDVLLQSLAKEPEKRYATGALLAEALRRALAVSQPAVDQLASGQPTAVQPTRPAAVPMTSPTASPRRTQKRELPPIPAAVVIAESPEFAPPPPVTAVSPKRRGGAFKWLFIAVLLIGLAGAGWYFLGGGREMLADGGNLPLAVIVPTTETSTPTSSPIPATATQEPTLTAVPPLPTATATATAAPTKTATAVPTASPTSLPTDPPVLAATATPSNTPLPTIAPSPTATPSSARFAAPR